ncbi:hypothetical protein C343_03522 [Cryptococcus neoformans C23]|uniref:CBM21 domain-containing protein n=2 Tax=Cryptococcus neoformans TaxID=5207 RepID=A0A854QB71_CRYNE|nr:hypothetical protein CNAG_07631 [Cryptococcus neoformans var. grubii H99]AUB25227.1 hypothetical protein CKF44_07631 [Cryptococcus neoformans var. grubii]OWZ31494.1 hypothetical protein C347_03585 [Cryptococcus neoformans var. grubii AD2-60a]OWZ43655.1 hypothetical protein C343_03522 [Cryptococcus neoformans var. grubii C23]OXC84311.1 hypothetical protein C344_03282 [Cryptococcus neoformans var. grubii AD1-7a]OXG20751.1 hypothetical protein C361_03728 [Cryptococcus neoformans var. grubii Tu|eukprot:XP_012050242.1 hypothetical protein CNAG_07631 [Cryptococcus neoformans var. grubii H99]
MVYTEPALTSTPPPAAPAKEPLAWRKAHTSTNVDDLDANRASAPIPTIPRRSSSSSASPRRTINIPRHHSPGRHSFVISKPLEGLPRRSINSPRPSISGLPPAGEGSALGIKLHGSPNKAPLSPVPKDLGSPSTNGNDASSFKGQANHGDSSSHVISFDPNFQPPKRDSPTRNPLSTSPRPGAPQRNPGSGHARGGQGTTGSLQIPFQSSASTSELPSGPSSLTAVRPSAAMIRKKSGEIVKPSLKPRSLSTPDLMRQGQDSPTNTSPNSFGTERSKSVRFADTSQGDAKALESVVLFLREQKVTAVGKAADPDNAQLTETETENDTDASDFVQFRTRKNAAARAADEANQIQLSGASRVPRKRTDFSPDARGSLTGENVILERVELQSSTGLTLRGSVIVRNVAFRKWVAVRFTLDQWQTVSEIAGTHVCHIPASTTGDEGWDRFSFSIKLEDYKRKIDERQLVLCVHYSVENKDWWDSNNGMNYSFTFKKSAPKRLPRNSGSANFGGSYFGDGDFATSLPGLRKGNTLPPSSQIKKVFGSKDNKASAGSSHWTFPKLFPHFNNSDARPRSDSPVQSPPPNSAYEPPAPPTVHTHLSLSKYCAPSPPQSPSKEQSTQSLPFHDPHHPPQQSSMDVVAGNYATISHDLQPPVCERRSSWNGQANSWDCSRATDNPDGKRLDGDKTPVAMASPLPVILPNVRSPDPSPQKPLTLKRSTGDLRKLVEDAEDENGLMTPPSSKGSSPPTPVHANLPPDLIYTSPASTGDTSSINTLSTESTPDSASLSIDTELHVEGRGRNGHPNDHKFFSADSYQEFLDKFCFFQSPRMTPNELEPMSRPSHIPISGSNSPNGFPFFGHSNASHSPRSTPTPTRHYNSAQEAFGFPAPSEDVTPTKRESMMPRMAHPQPVQDSSVSQIVSGYHANPADTMAWAQQIHSNSVSPSLAAAK